jgi:signal transduction histidine kinase
LSIRAKLLLLILFAMLTPLIVGLVVMRGIRAEQVENAKHELAAATTQVAQSLTDTIRSTAQLHYGLSRSRDLDTPDRKTCSDFLAAVLGEHPQYTGILTIKPNGRLFCDSLHTGRTLDLNDRRYFREALGAQGPLAVEPAFGRLTGAAVLQIAYGVRKENGDPRFVLLASLNLEKFLQPHEQALPKINATIALVDGKGQILTWHPNGDNLRGTSIAGTELHRFAAGTHGTALSEGIEYGGASSIWSASSLPGFDATDLRVLVGVSRDELLATADAKLNRARLTMVVIWVLVFLGALGLAEFAIRRQTARVVAAVAKFGAGDFEARIGAPYPRGEIGGLMVALDQAFADMQAQRALVHRLNSDLERRVAERTAELESFSYTVSHDLRAPLRHIHGFAQLVAERLQAPDPETRRFLGKITLAARRMEELIDDLLELSRAGRTELKTQAVDLEAVVHEVREEYSRDAGDRRIAWKVGALPTVQGDPRLLRQVFVNLVGNAFKYTAGLDEAVIEVSAAPAGHGEVCVSVRDNGFGFDMAYADKLFGPFQRLHSDPRFEGTGIGLATVKRIVERHGGQVWGEGVPGKGAVFSVVLKAA